MQDLGPRLSAGVGEGGAVRLCVRLALDGEVCVQEPSPDAPRTFPPSESHPSLPSTLDVWGAQALSLAECGCPLFPERA